MSPLGRRIAKLIAAQGPIPVSQYMMLALHDPEHGVYASRDPIGRAGDFVTAPEISQMFGELLGLWMIEVWRQQGSPKRIKLVELGPGRGTLIKDVLRAARLDTNFLASLDVVLIEASPALKKVQAETLRDSPTEISWSAKIGDVFDDRALFLLANEFFDALPVHQYVMTEQGWHERMVIEKNGRLDFALAPMAIPGLVVPEARGTPAKGAVFESSPAATALAEDIASHIAGQGGAALIVDYGYGAAGFGETLQAIAGHKRADILQAPGDADISAHVDFAALAGSADRGGAKAFGPSTQGTFLENLRIAQRAQQLAKKNPSQSGAIELAHRRLTEADQMGNLFKALAILPTSAPQPPGF